MRIAFRADASTKIGTGHVIRCLTLADELARNGHLCVFFVKNHEGNLNEYISARGYEVRELEAAVNCNVDNFSCQYEAWLGWSWKSDIYAVENLCLDETFDWVVVDHYALDAKWEKYFLARGSKVLAIDDLANRSHECSILLDQNYGAEKGKYKKHLEGDVLLLLGSKYALLRPEFYDARSRGILNKERGLKKLLINMGGVDQHNVTELVLRALSASSVARTAELTVLVGAGYPYFLKLSQFVEDSKLNIRLLQSASNVAELMCEADLAIGAAGATTWERFSLGLPSILVSIAENQSDILSRLKKDGLVEALDVDEIGSKLPLIVDGLSIEKLAFYSSKCADVCDGRGAIRVVHEIEAVEGDKRF